MDLLLIDGIGPFFRGVGGRRINWSKVPFHRLEKDAARRGERFAGIRRDLEDFAEGVASEGFNALSLDDVAHLVDHPLYEPETRELIADFQAEYRRLFDILRRRDLEVFVTMDILSSTPALRAALGTDQALARSFLRQLVDGFFCSFPEVAGLILRIGESDGKDVKGVFRSDLLLRTTGQVNRLLRELLPVFESHGKLLILRTWTVGAHQIGDLIWHRGTFARALDGIDSPALVLSMKYGESDFFRYLPLNRNFFRTSHKTLIELQTRREYEGCGEYPSFVGWDYEHYARELTQAPNLIGVSVWCQTGGWAPFRRLAYLDGGEGLWTELNTAVTVAVFKNRTPVEQAVRRWAEARGIEDSLALIELLRLSDEVVKELLYVRDFAEQKLFFRRARVPPLVAVIWGNIFVTHSVRKLLRHFVADGERCVREGYSALEKIERMKQLARPTGLPAADIDFMADTFRLLALAREYYFEPYSEEIRQRLRRAKKDYKGRYPRGVDARPRYRVKLDFTPFRLSSRRLGWLLHIVTRRQRGYRVIDHLLTLHALAFVYRLLRRSKPKLIPKFARKTAMGIDAVFR